jgi:diaminopimelate epimerase
MRTTEPPPSLRGSLLPSIGLPFYKYHGLGNDFIVLDFALKQQDTPAIAARTEEALRRVTDAAWVQRVCDRHFGIGADGVLLVTPPETDGARARMTVLNADGSRPEMCGNGLRCVALHLGRRAGAERAEYTVDTDAGPRLCNVDRAGDEGQVTAALGRAQVAGQVEHSIGGERLLVTQVNVGNPHAVIFDALYNETQIDRLAAELSLRVRGGVNVEFVRPASSERFEIVVWERGVGRTLACGTGAAAVAAAASVAGRARFDSWIATGLPGGALAVRVHEHTLDVDQRGPAELVYSGRLALGSGGAQSADFD